MKRLAFLGLLLVLLSGCQPWWNVSDDYDPIFSEIPVLNLESPQEIGWWLYFNIRRISDAIHDTSEYWQSPDQTYVWRAGDCEDLAILMMYLIRQELGGWPELAMGKYDNFSHGWVIYNGRWYEAQGGQDVTNDPHYTLLETVSYGVTMWRSMNTHKAMEEE